MNQTLKIQLSYFEGKGWLCRTFRHTAADYDTPERAIRTALTHYDYSDKQRQKWTKLLIAEYEAEDGTFISRSLPADGKFPDCGVEGCNNRADVVYQRIGDTPRWICNDCAEDDRETRWEIAESGGNISAA